MAFICASHLAHHSYISLKLKREQLVTKRIWTDDDNHYLLLPYHVATVVSGHASTNYRTACVQLKFRACGFVPQKFFLADNKEANIFLLTIFLGKK